MKININQNIGKKAINNYLALISETQHEIQKNKNEIEKLKINLKLEKLKNKSHCEFCLSFFGYITKKGFFCRKCGKITKIN